jgi:hypothetical protein
MPTGLTGVPVSWKNLQSKVISITAKLWITSLLASFSMTYALCSMPHASSLQGGPVFSLAPVLVLCYPIHTFQFGSIYFNEFGITY